MAPLLWPLCYGPSAMAPVLWPLCYGPSTMVPLLCFAMAPLLWPNTDLVFEWFTDQLLFGEAY